MRIHEENGRRNMRGMHRCGAIALMALLIVSSPGVIEAAQGTCQTVRLLTSDFSDTYGPYTPEQYLNIKVADVDGDGQNDVCYPEVRTSPGLVLLRGGIMCRTSSTGFAVSKWTSAFQSSTWINNEAYWGTIRFQDLNADGKADICGRGPAGIICALSTGSSFRMPGSSIFSDGTTVWSTLFSDANGWNSDPSYWKTIQFPDLNHDGMADVCGRASDGIYCALSNGTFFEPAVATAIFTNANGWNGSPSRWSTIQFADVTGDGRPDACGRGVSGIWCAEYNGNGFNYLRLWTSDYGDSVAPGWFHEEYYATLQFADVNYDGKADVCARGSAGIYCSASTGNLFGYASLVNTDFSDAGGWNNARFYKSIRIVDLNGGTGPNRAYAICGRGFAGILCANIWSWPNYTIHFSATSLVVPNFGDADGWGASESYWATVQPFGNLTQTYVYNGVTITLRRFEWIGRGHDGIYISIFDNPECGGTFLPS